MVLIYLTEKGLLKKFEKNKEEGRKKWIGI
jgi:hypothetical protein